MGVDSNCSFVYPWLDLRLSALLPWTKPFFVSVELELRVSDVKQTVIARDLRRFLFWTVILTIVKLSHDISDVCSAVTYIRRWQQLFVHSSMTWFEVVGTASWTKPFFVAVECGAGFHVNKQLIMRILSILISVGNLNKPFSFLLNWIGFDVNKQPLWGFVGFCFELSSLIIVQPAMIFLMLLSGHVHGRWVPFVRLSMTWLRLSAPLPNKTLFRCPVEFDPGFWCKQTAGWRDSWLGMSSVSVLNCHQTNHSSVSRTTPNQPPKLIFLMCCCCHVHVCDSNRSFVYPWLIWGCRQLLHEQNPFSVVAELELGFDVKQNSSLWGFLHDWFWDCRHCFMNKNLFFVLLNWLGFDVNNSSLWVIRRFRFETVIHDLIWDCRLLLSRTTNCHSIHEVAVSVNFFVEPGFDVNKQLTGGILSMTWFEIVEHCFMNKTLFRFCWIGARFLMQNKQLIYEDSSVSVLNCHPQP